MSFENLKNIVTTSKECGNSKKITIYEKGKDAKLTKVILQSFKSEKDFWFSFDDRKGRFCPSLTDKTGQGYKKVCDAFIACTFDGVDYLLFVELKSTSLDRDEIEKKFRSSSCMIDYCDSILNEFFSDFVLTKCKVGYFVFYKSKLPKDEVSVKREMKGQPSSMQQPIIISFNTPVKIKKLIRFCS